MNPKKIRDPIFHYASSPPIYLETIIFKCLVSFIIEYFWASHICINQCYSKPTTVQLDWTPQRRYGTFRPTLTTKLLRARRAYSNWPGPFAPPENNRPRRNITARSYSCTTYQLIYHYYVNKLIKKSVLLICYNSTMLK